jgi:nicotinamide mononucleotide transporter
MADIVQQFVENIQKTIPLEYIAVASGILSVWFSKKENILVYPVGLISTVIYIYLSFTSHLIGEASVNFYYTIMSIYGWYIWTKKDVSQRPVLRITFSNKAAWLGHLVFFVVLYIILFFALTLLKKEFYPGVIPWADGFASATAFTGMWLMARKKVESWYWWIATNIASVPLYFVKGLMLTSVYYLVLLVMALFGLAEWKRRANNRSAKQ